MNILIIGGTGKTGRQLIVQGLAEGHKITAMVRNLNKLKMSHPNLNIIQGDILKFNDVQAAVKHQTTVLCALGHKHFFIPSTTLSKGTGNLVKAMEEGGLERLICITSLGINDSRFKLGLYYTCFVIPLILFFYFRDKSFQEKLIMESTINWTIVRPAQLTNGRKRTQYQYGSNVGHYLLTKMISRADVAHFMLQELKKKQFLRKIVGLHY